MERILILAALLALCYALLRLERLIPRGGGIGVMAVLLISFAARWWLWDRTPSGAEDSVRDAITWFRNAGGLWGLKNCREPFSLPVQFLLAVCSLPGRGGPDLWKGISLLADILSAWAAQKCVGTVRTDAGPRLIVFAVFLLLPSVILQNTASLGMGFRWLFPLLACAGALGGRYRLTGISLGLAVMFHPAALLLLPFCFVFPLIRQNPGKTALWMLAGWGCPLAAFLLIGKSPSLLFPFWPRPDAADLIRPGTAPGIFTLPGVSLPVWAGIAVYLAVLVLTVFRLGTRDAVHDRRRQLGGLALGAAVMASFLPGMGAAALFGAEALTLALAALEPKAIPATICLCGASALSLLGPLVSFTGAPGWAAAAALGGAALLLLYVLFKRS